MKVEQTKTSAEIVADRIRTMPLDKEYQAVPNLPIPLEIGVLIKKIAKPANVIKIEGIVNMEQATQELHLLDGVNSREPNLGIIMAVGPKCSEFLRVGLRCFWDVNQTGTFRHEGVDYYRMDQYCVYYIVPDPSTIDKVEVKDPREVRRAKAMEKDKSVMLRMDIRNENDKDREAESKKKGKNIFLT